MLLKDVLLGTVSTLDVAVSLLSLHATRDGGVAPTNTGPLNLRLLAPPFQKSQGIDYHDAMSVRLTVVRPSPRINGLSGVALVHKRRTNIRFKVALWFLL